MGLDKPGLDLGEAKVASWQISILKKILTSLSHTKLKKGPKLFPTNETEHELWVCILSNMRKTSAWVDIDQDGKASLS